MAKISLCLIICLMQSILPSATTVSASSSFSTYQNGGIHTNSTIAKETTGDSKAILQEDISLRREYEKHFLMEDGSYQVALYNEPIHKVENGKWVEVDNSLELRSTANGESQYETVNGLADISFAQKFDDQLVTIRQDNYSITWGVKAVPDSQNAAKSAYAEVKPVQAKLVVADTSAFSAEEQKMLATKSLSTIQYCNALRQDVDLEYIVLPSRVKENIILQSAQDISCYIVTVHTENLYARLLENREVEFYNNSDEVMFTMASPYMYDSVGELSENITVEMVSMGNGCYFIKMTPDAQWLRGDNRVYPVVIDPQVSVDTTRTNIIDNYVLKGSGNQNRNLDRLYIGTKANATARTYIKYDTMPTLPANSTITSATMRLQLVGGTATAANASAYKVTGGDWASGTITWDNKPEASIALATNINHNNLTGYTFSCKSAVQSWYSGSTTGNNANYGIMMRYYDESIDDYNAFYSADCTNETRRPLLTINYNKNVTSISLSSTSATINVGSTQALSVSFTPTTATDKSVTWTSSNSAVARVNTSGVVTGVNPGTAIITCTSNDSGVAATCSITVKPTSYTRMSFSTFYVGTLSEGRHFWYEFKPSETGYYTFSSEATSVDVKAYLFSGTTQIDYDDDSGKLLQFKICHKLNAGTTYHLRVQGAFTFTTGTFRISVSKGWPKVTKPTIYTRADWGAMAKDESRLVERTRDPERIIYHHSAEKFSKTDWDSCKAEIKRIQDLHMNNEGKCDIAYHFIIDPAGRIWQGAEIDDYQRGHAGGHFDDIGVLVLGDFESRAVNLWVPNTLNNAQKNAMIEIGKWLCYEYDIPVEVTNGPITTHRQVNPGSTVCPGEEMAPWVEGMLLDTIRDWRK